MSKLDFTTEELAPVDKKKKCQCYECYEYSQQSVCYSCFSKQRERLTEEKHQLWLRIKKNEIKIRFLETKDPEEQMRLEMDKLQNERFEVDVLTDWIQCCYNLIGGGDG